MKAQMGPGPDEEGSLGWCEVCDGYLVPANDGISVYRCHRCGQHYDGHLNRVASWCGIEGVVG